MDAIRRTSVRAEGSGFADNSGGESSSSSSSPPRDRSRMVAQVEEGYADRGARPINNNHAYALEPNEREEQQRQSQLWWSRIRDRIRDPAAEFLGCFTMIVFGDGSVAQVTLSRNPNLPLSSRDKGDYQSISWGWGLGVMLGIYVAGCAGGHLNPAVTWTHCVFRGFPWRRWPAYALAQIAGCFCGAAVIYANYKSAIDEYEGGAGVRTVPGYSDTATAGVFCTFPQPFLTTTGMFFSEFVASAMLVLVIFALKDDSNLGAGNLVPLALFFLIFGLGATLGWETGYAMNLARDFGPRLFAYSVGYGSEVWSAGNYYFWIPMMAPFLGCTFGGFVYAVFIFTGDSPINTPWMGLKRIGRPDLKEVWKRGRLPAKLEDQVEAASEKV